MRTMTVPELQEHLDLCLGILRQFLETGRWAYRVKARSLAQAEKLVSLSRKKARHKIRRLEAQCPHRRQSAIWQWVSSVLMAETWRFTLWLRDQREHAAEDLQDQEEIELLLLSCLGAEIKRLGFQLDF